jgi:hypothetical protein
MFNLLDHFSCYCIAFNHMFTASTLSPTFPTCLSSLEQMEPMPSQVRNHYSQNNQEGHIEWAYAFKQATNLHFQWYHYVWMICLRVSCHRWGISPNSWTQQSHDTDQDNGDHDDQDEYEDTRESTLSTEIGEDDFDHQQHLLLLGQVTREKLLRTTSVPLQIKPSHANTVIACSLLSNSRNSLGSMAPPLLKCHKSALLNTSSKSDRAPSPQVLLQFKSSGNQDVPHSKSSADPHIAEHQKATVEIATRFMEAIVFMQTPCVILFNDMYAMLDEGWELAIATQNHQRVVAGAPVNAPLECELPSRPSFKIDLQTRTALSLGFHLMLFCQFYNIDYTPIDTYCTWKKSTIWRQLDDGAHQTVFHGYQLNLLSVIEVQIRVKKPLCDDADCSTVVDDKKILFTPMQVIDLIWHKFIFTANTLEHQQTTSQHFQPPTPLALALVATALYCVLSEYPTGQKATVMFSQDNYWGTFCPSSVINYTLKSTALIIHTSVGCLKPPSAHHSAHPLYDRCS